MKNWKLTAGILLIFILGALAGALASGYYLKQRQYSIKRDPSVRTEFIVKRLSRSLDLTEAQTRKVRDTVERMHHIQRAHRLEHRAKIRAIRKKGFKEIRKGLTPIQQEKMDQLLEEFEKRKKKRDRKLGRREP
jgi:hypothetical protein